MRKCHLIIVALISFGIGAMGCNAESIYNEEASNIETVSQPPADPTTQPTEQPTTPPQDPTTDPTEYPTDMPTEEPAKKPCDGGPTGDPPRLSDECSACIASHPKLPNESDADYDKRLAEACGGTEEGVWACTKAQGVVRGLGVAVAGAIVTCEAATAGACTIALLALAGTVIAGLETYLDGLKDLFAECNIAFSFDFCPQGAMWYRVCQVMKGMNLNGGDATLRDKICGAGDAAKAECPAILFP
jgi:hypothetical protein